MITTCLDLNGDERTGTGKPWNTGFDGKRMRVGGLGGDGVDEGVGEDAAVGH